MIFKRGSIPWRTFDAPRPTQEKYIAKAAGISSVGVNEVLLPPGVSSSDRHWHAVSDEVLYVLEGCATIVEEQAEYQLTEGECACWPGGVANGHTVENRSDAAVRFLVIGTNPKRDEVRYPDRKETLFHDHPRWRIVDDDGNLKREGTLTNDDE